MSFVTVERYHDISAGHRVVGHEGKCRFLHGHNYRVTFTCTAAQLDEVGRVIDFGVIKNRLCNWLEEHWDHRMLMWEADPILEEMQNSPYRPNIDPVVGAALAEAFALVPVPFNPTAENMALHLLNVIGPLQLAGTGVVLAYVKIEETRKCSAAASNRLGN